VRGIAIILALLAAPLTAPLAAQELSFSSLATEACLSSAENAAERAVCAGEAANACMRDTPGGYATVVIGGCFSLELDWWDAKLNAIYQVRLKEAQAFDATIPDYLPSQVEALRAMQRAWIPFRDEKCGFERTQWGGGTGAGPAFLACLMHETADQVLYLEFSRMGG